MTRHKPADARQRLLARVHMARKALGLDEETYRQLLDNSFGVRSAKEMPLLTLEDLARSLERELGQKRRAGSYPGRPHNMGPQGPRDARRDAAQDSSRAAQLQKIEAYLAEAGRAWAYADALAQRICKVDKVAWVETHELYKLITALKKDAERHGREPT
jgi:phage gp16-like protein